MIRKPRDQRPREGTEARKASLGLPELIAIGVGGMIGGGIFSVLGIAVRLAGHAAPLAFVLGSLVALVAGYSYVKLALGCRSDGASFTYLERAFPMNPNIAGIAGWVVVVGYVGTLALYAFTFGAYGSHLLGSAASTPVRVALSAGVLLFFMVVNLWGTRASGRVEDLVVYTKVTLLGVFAAAGLTTVRSTNLTPVFDRGPSSVFVAGAMIFVAFEGFQLITNAVLETHDAERNIPRGIYGSITVTSIIYVTVAVVALGNLTVPELVEAEEYALARAGGPALGTAGVLLVDVAALLATSSAINATAFGASRMMAEMALKRRMPLAFSFRSRTRVPWIAVVVLTALALVFTALGSLETIAAFSSLTFLLVSIGVSVANYRLRRETSSNRWIVLLGIVLMLTTVALLAQHLWSQDRSTLIWVSGLFGSIAVMEIVFFERLEWSSVRSP